MSRTVRLLLARATRVLSLRSMLRAGPLTQYEGMTFATPVQTRLEGSRELAARLATGDATALLAPDRLVLGAIALLPQHRRAYSAAFAVTLMRAAHTLPRETDCRRLLNLATTCVAFDRDTHVAAVRYALDATWEPLAPANAPRVLTDALRSRHVESLDAWGPLPAGLLVHALPENSRLLRRLAYELHAGLDPRDLQALRRLVNLCGVLLYASWSRAQAEPTIGEVLVTVRELAASEHLAGLTGWPRLVMHAYRLLDCDAPPDLMGLRAAFDAVATYGSPALLDYVDAGLEMDLAELAGLHARL